MSIPSPAPWRILSDDLTGALDSAAAWAASDAVPVFLDQPQAAPQAVQCVVSGTRDLAPPELPSRLAPSLDWLAGSGWAYKKIDSLLRGNSFAEIAWLLRSGRFEGAVFAPAFPAQGRFTANDRHWVAPPHQPQGPRTHEFAGSLHKALADAGLQAWRPEQVSQSLQRAMQVAVPDLLCDADLDALAALAHTPQARRWLWCGSAGLAWALARHEGRTAASAAHPPPPPAGPLLLLTASRHPVLRAQLRGLDGLLPGLTLVDLADAEPLAPAEAQARLDQGMRELLATQQRPARLLVVGGDTLLALCRAAGVHSLLAGPSPRPGWGSARLCGGVWDGLSCWSRSGAFGADDDLRAALAAQPSPIH